MAWEKQKGPGIPVGVEGISRVKRAEKVILKPGKRVQRKREEI